MLVDDELLTLARAALQLVRIRVLDDLSLRRRTRSRCEVSGPLGVCRRCRMAPSTPTLGQWRTTATPKPGGTTFGCAAKAWRERGQSARLLASLRPAAAIRFRRLGPQPSRLSSPARRGQHDRLDANAHPGEPASSRRAFGRSAPRCMREEVLVSRASGTAIINGAQKGSTSRSYQRGGGVSPPVLRRQLSR